MEVALSHGLNKPQLQLNKYMISFNYFLFRTYSLFCALLYEKYSQIPMRQGT